MTGPERWTLERIDHPVVPLLVATDEGGAVLRISLGAHLESVEAHARAHGAVLEPAVGGSSEAVEQLREYLAGARETFDLSLRPLGTEFQQAAWQALTQIPYGETRSYAQQAAAMDNPRAVRAVGQANGENPLPIVIPCHRVIGADGSLTGFGGGLVAKRWLLEHEAPQLALGIA